MGSSRNQITVFCMQFREKIRKDTKTNVKHSHLLILAHSNRGYTVLQGDLIPWTIGQQFQDPDFPSLSGARIVRIAVHPGLNRAG